MQKASLKNMFLICKKDIEINYSRLVFYIDILFIHFRDGVIYVSELLFVNKLSFINMKVILRPFVAVKFKNGTFMIKTVFLERMDTFQKS